MPEGPEVTIIREGLHKLLKRKYVHSIKIGDGRMESKSTLVVSVPHRLFTSNV